MGVWGVKKPENPAKIANLGKLYRLGPSEIGLPVTDYGL
jgi:hypothetical protein